MKILLFSLHAAFMASGKDGRQVVNRWISNEEAFLQFKEILCADVSVATRLNTVVFELFQAKPLRLVLPQA